MARTFNGSSEYLYGSASDAVVPLAMCGWFRVANVTAGHTIAAIADTGSDTNYHVLIARGDVAGDYVNFQSRGSGGTGFAASTASFSANTWHHAAGWESANNNRKAFLDGANGGTNSGNTGTTSGLDTIAVGNLKRSTAIALASNGSLAEVAIWDLSAWPGATAADKAALWETHALPALAAGASPLFFPIGLIHYLPLGGMASESADQDFGSGAVAFTAVDTPTTAEHPRIWYPSPVIMPVVSSGVVPATSMLYWLRGNKRGNKTGSGVGKL